MFARTPAAFVRLVASRFTSLPSRAACDDEAARVRRAHAAARRCRLRPCSLVTDAAARKGLGKKWNGEIPMIYLRTILEAAAGAILVAAVLGALMALPGFVSDRDSTVPLPTAKLVRQ